VPRKSLADALSPAKWRQMEESVDRALAWLASRQQADGSFPTAASGQPAVTSLCVLALLSRGHQPGAGPYGEQVNRAIDFVLSCQLEDGLLCQQVPGPTWQRREPSHTAPYNHAIDGLMLGEAYGQVTGERAARIKTAIEKALVFTRQLQTRPKPPSDQGGWRYFRLQSDTATDSDLSVTAWQLMFLRSARNAEFQVPAQQIEEAMGFVRRCWDPGLGMFAYAFSHEGLDYALTGPRYSASRGMTGAGIVSLSMGGQHQTPKALAAGNWLLAHPFRSPGELTGGYDMFIYSTYYCSQAAAQLGGRYWEQIFSRIVEVLLGYQSGDGSWPAEANLVAFGDEMTTAFAVLSLTPAYQLLPVYQR
jgi:hypothetical protein